MNNPESDQSFEDIYIKYKRMIHYQIHKLNLRDPHQEFFQEGIIALWEAHQKYGHDPTFPKLATIHIRSRLIDLIRKQKRIQDKEALDEFIQEQPVLNNNIEHYDPQFWSTVRKHLSDKQWIFIQKRIIEGHSIKEIAQQEEASIDAVKGWGQAAKRKLRSIMTDYR
ncbi:sigma-70 family RNA polymerase sigma factor [Alkalibacillus silvisoli]|uniref:Sigma-70 family RNA polymerase sigma factor n=1 Tax=Alkalibacillus silvisoli TaxID=392823 RepID=A0ABP3JEZ4_9BACI